MGRLVHLFWVPVALIALPLLLLYYLADTPGGTAQLQHLLNRRIGPVTIHVSGASGTLAHGVHVQQLLIDHRRVHIEIDDVDATLAILPLAWQTIRVPRLHAARLLIHALPRSGPNSEWRPHFLPALIRIQAESVQVDAGILIATGGQQFNGEGLSASGTVYPRTIRIYAGELTYNGVHLRTNGELQAASSLGLTGALHLDAEPRSLPPWTVNARFNGNLAQLAVAADVSEPFDAEFDGSLSQLTDRFHWQGRALVRRLQLSAWHAGNALGDLSGTLTVRGERSQFSAQGVVLAPGLKAGPIDSEFSGAYHQRVLSVTHLKLQHPAAGTVLEAAGVVDFSNGRPQLDLQGQWSQFRWPLAAADAPVHSARGRLTLRGTLPYAISTQGELSVANLPTLDINLQGQLAADALDADQALVRAYGGQLQLTGAIHWGKQPGWRMQGRVSDLDIAQVRRGIDGSVSFGVRAQGSGFRRSDDFQASVSDLSGTVHAQRAAGRGSIARRGDSWQFDDVHLQLGATHIDADGTLGTQLALNYSLESSDLGLIRNGAHGQLSARGALRGNVHDPTILTTASVRNLEWNGVQLAGLQADIAFDPHGTGRVDSSITLHGLQIGQRRLDQMTLRLDGSTAQHRLSIEARAQQNLLNLHGGGRYSAGEWQEQITDATLTDQSRLHMTLQSASALLLSAERLQLEPMCLRDEQAQLCASFLTDTSRRQFELRATDMPMRALTAGLTAATEYDGTLNVVLNAAAQGDEPMRGSVQAQLMDAAIRKRFENGRVQTLDLGNGEFDASLSARDISAKLALDAGAAGSIQGHLAGHGSDNDWRHWPVSGELKIETDALGFIDSYLTQIDRASGRLAAQLTLSGSADVPQLAGDLKISAGELDAYQINLSVRDLNFSAHLADTALNFEGSASAGPDGHASISGALDWKDNLPYGTLHLQGSDMRVLNLPEARVDASPDVTVKVDGRRIGVRGQVTLPYARIEPAELVNAVLPSGDEVLVGENNNGNTEAQFRVSSDITLALGERVTVRTQGLSGRLSGRLTVTTDDTGINRASGELNVEEGKYLAYGRNLDVQHGRLLFSSGLLGDPALDLRAVKKFPDITAGVNVRGTLRAPRMTFFSEPEVPQSQIVSLLLAGGSLASVQNTNSTDPSERNNNGRSDLLMQGGAILAQQIGGRYDIEAGVEQDLTNETSLVLGRYLSPRLYVSYGIGLAEAINTIKMRYTIGDHWTIKTEAGTQRSADMVYTIER